jgi:enoyl-CoA hydratase
MMAGVMAVAKQIASHSPLTVTGTKELLNYGRNHGVDEGLNYTATWQAGMFRNTDLIESMQARQEQRDADYLPIESLAFKL